MIGLDQHLAAFGPRRHRAGPRHVSVPYPRVNEHASDVRRVAPSRNLRRHAACRSDVCADTARPLDHSGNPCSVRVPRLRVDGNATGIDGIRGVGQMRHPRDLAASGDGGDVRVLRVVWLRNAPDKGDGDGERCFHAPTLSTPRPGRKLNVRSVVPHGAP